MKLKELIKNPCKECVYYHEENNTCQSKKVATGGSGYITVSDRLFCKPRKTTIKQEMCKQAQSICNHNCESCAWGEVEEE